MWLPKILGRRTSAWAGEAARANASRKVFKGRLGCGEDEVNFNHRLHRLEKIEIKGFADSSGLL
jgi:hypothetical protein